MTTPRPHAALAATSIELIVGHVYEAKRPKSVGLFEPLMNDRQIKWIGFAEVQYDSPTVGFGRSYPRISKEAFLKWAARDITKEMPPGEWRRGGGA